MKIIQISTVYDPDEQKTYIFGLSEEGKLYEFTHFLIGTGHAKWNLIDEEINDK